MNSLAQWVPVAIEGPTDAARVELRFVGDHRFTEPFFDDSLAVIGSAERASRQIPATALAESAEVDGLEPSAFFLHCSRCGSTLLSQLFAMSARCVVISEAPVVDAALERCRVEATRPQALELLRAVVRSLGRRRRGQTRHLLVKLDSWHVTQVSSIREAFPDTPLYFLYRHPLEVLTSHRRQRGQQMVPGLIDPSLLGLEESLADLADLDGFCVKVLTSFFRSATSHAMAAELRLLHSSQLPELVWMRLAPELGIELDEAEIRAMRERSGRHSKRPGEIFAGDPAPIDGDWNTEAYHELERRYDELELLRSAQRIS